MANTHTHIADVKTLENSCERTVLYTILMNSIRNIIATCLHACIHATLNLFFTHVIHTHIYAISKNNLIIIFFVVYFFFFLLFFFLLFSFEFDSRRLSWFLLIMGCSHLLSLLCIWIFMLFLLQKHIDICTYDLTYNTHSLKCAKSYGRYFFVSFFRKSFFLHEILELFLLISSTSLSSLVPPVYYICSA